MYPNVHREVGRLVLSGLVSISDYRPKQQGKYARSAGCFRLTAAGRNVAGEIMEAPQFEAIGRLLSDVAFGLGELDQNVIDAAVRSDPTYAQPGKSAGQVIRFKDPDENRSARAVTQISEHLKDIAPPSRLDVVATFAEVLRGRASM
jgi:hypothetical protein